MSKHTTVEVFLGSPITIASERALLARLQRDLLTRGVSARILANLTVGRDDRQIDFVVVTQHRSVLFDEKTFSGPIVDGPKNGPWKVQVGAGEVRERGNPLRQALDATHALSDELQAFAATGQAPAPPTGKFFRGIDTLVCAFPRLPHGSRFYKDHQYVTVVGYDALLDRLQRPGPRIEWSEEEWDAFGRHLNLYRADEDSPEGIVRREGAAVVDAYLGRYLQANAELPPLVATGVRIDDGAAPRPALADELVGGRGVLLHGASGLGKTLWARTTAAELARTGHVPIWLAADVCEPSFRTSAARAIAPYTALSPEQLLHAAEAAGRAAVFVIDDLTRSPEPVRQALLDGAQAVRVRNPTRGLLITAQTADAASALSGCLNVALAVPDDGERHALLDAYGAPEIIDRCDAFITPLELALAAACAGELPAGAGAAELLDRHIDQRVGGDDGLREGLRIIASRMHAQLMPSVPRPELVRTLRRDHGITDVAMQALLSCPLVTVAHGRLAFRHERFEHFLAAEAMLLAARDPQALARTLNTPRCADLRADVIALEAHEDRLGTLLSACEDAEVLFAAAVGRLGALAARVTDTLLVDTLNVACAQTTAAGVTFEAGDGLFDGRWRMPDTAGAGASAAQLTAIGRLLPLGRYVEGTARLLDHTDALCASAITNAGPRARGLASYLFGTTYVLQGPHGGLPASTLVSAVTSHWGRRHDEQGATRAAAALLRRNGGPGLGALYVAGHLLHHSAPSPITADVIVACLTARRYHLRLLGLTLAHDLGRELDEPARRVVVDAVRALRTDNIMLNSSIVDALSMLGDITPDRDVDDISAEIATVLGMQHDPDAYKLACGIVSNQFESDVIGPYYEAVQELPDHDRERLLVMALRGDDTDGFCVGWIMHELDDLSDPVTRAAVVDYVARTNPSRWNSPQSGMQGVVGALGLLAADGTPLPDPVDGGSREPAWRAGMTVILGVLADAAGHAVDRPGLDSAWASLVGEHRDSLASLLLNLRSIHGLASPKPERVHELVAAALPNGAVDALVWSLEHPDEVRPLCRHEHGLRGYVVGLLGQLGDRRTADVLRRFADDPEVGEAAAAAVRAIETRALA